MRALSILAFAAAAFGACIAVIAYNVLCYGDSGGTDMCPNGQAILGVALWVGWGVLNDASVHGWGSGMRFVP